MGPSHLTLTKAKVSGESGLNNQPQVRLTFNTLDDSTAFDRFAAANYQHQVAIVMFGRVLSAPTIQQTRYNGNPAIGPVEP